MLALDRIPSSDATGDWLRRSFDNGGLEGLVAANRTILARGLRDDGLLSYTLDMDATGIEAWKESVRMTYKGYRGYMPLVGHIAENGLVVGDEFRHGNESPSVRNLSFLKYCKRQMPEGKRIGALRADSAAYQAGIIDYCDDHEIGYAIGADLDRSVVEQIAHIEAGDWHDYQDGHIAETVHCMNKSCYSFRLIVVRRPYQNDLFDDGESAARYKVIATNREGTSEEVLHWYNQRGQRSENRIKELKIGFGMERMPCGQFGANAVFFRICVLAYNLDRLFVLKTLDSSWHHHQV